MEYRGTGNITHMTKESKEVITEVCRERLWEKECNYRIPTLGGLLDGDGSEEFLLAKHIGKPADFEFVWHREFPTAEEARDFYEALEPLQNIWVTRSVKVGKIEQATDGRLWMEGDLVGKHVFQSFNRESAAAIFTATYIYSSPKGVADADFLTYINRNGGKHWDDLLGGDNALTRCQEQ